MPGRSHTSGTGYRYGFNGQEKVDEICGIGNHNTAEFWEYDSRFGRRWELDPLIKYHESPYACLAENPIWFNDQLGADTGDVVVTFGGGDWKGNNDKGDVAPEIVKNIKENHINTEGGKAESFVSQFWNAKPNDKTALDNATQEAYEFTTSYYNCDAEGNDIKGGRILIYGYSQGGVLATHLSKRLEAINYTVNSLYTIDAASAWRTNAINRAISSNVLTNTNFYQTTPSPVGSYGGINLAVNQNKTKIFQAELKSVSHADIDNFTMQIVIKSMLGVLRNQPYRK